MKQRIITGSLLVIVLGLLIYFGEGPLEFLFSGLCVLLATIASWEFSRMLNKDKPFSPFNYLAVLFTFSFTFINVIWFRQADLYYLIFFLFIVSMLLVYALLYIFYDKFTFSDFSGQILTVFYTSLGFIAFAYLRILSIHLIIYLLLVAMLTDVFAYLFGIKFGKHRLAIKISPKKSIEGAIAGFLIGGTLAALYAYLVGFMDYNLVYLLLISFSLSIISQIGDLVASKFKREADIKDYSQIFPGHGGVLDRFDSSMFAAIFLMILVMVW
ncbi:MAG: phosphatidate cytidylyltransferase [Candidatus Izemoplasmatales bacterium]|nr:phosphatidate cytidylyltransferase [Candidatus Izemoplasmatales bacterium]